MLTTPIGTRTIVAERNPRKKIKAIAAGAGAGEFNKMVCTLLAIDDVMHAGARGTKVLSPGGSEILAVHHTCSGREPGLEDCPKSSFFSDVDCTMVAQVYCQGNFYNYLRDIMI